MPKTFHSIFKSITRAFQSRNSFSEDFVRKNNYYVNPLKIINKRKEWQNFIKEIAPYPKVYSGRGIVMCAGGFLYLTCAWVCINMLRKSGCTLDIELWYVEGEINDTIIINLNKLGVVCKKCSEYSKTLIQGYEIKSFAIVNSSFKEVLFLDADNNCVKDPTYLFHCTEYLDTGAIFWPDAWTTAFNNPIWKIIGSNNYSEKEQESGQILINKEKCWKELNLCMYFNIHSSFYYKFLLGDKDTFKFAWIALSTKYHMIETPLGFCGFMTPDQNFHGFSMVQHDPKGEILFIHRNLIKWAITKDEEVLMTHIKRIKKGEKIKFKPKFINMNSYKLGFTDLQGDFELLSFKELFDDYELECLDILKTLRKSDFYASFLLHIALTVFRPGFRENSTSSLMGKMG